MFSPRCDGCHAEFAVEDSAREPVTVGCFHTICRACAEGDKGAYGKLSHLADPHHHHPPQDERGEGDGQHHEVGMAQGGDEEARQAGRGAVRGRCAVCGGGSGNIEVREAVAQALRLARDGEEEEEGTEQPHKRFRAGEGVGTPLPLLLCPTHCHQPLLKFCNDHKCLVCAECAATSHSGHAIVEVGKEGMASEVQGWLGEEAAKAVARARELDEAEPGLVAERQAMLEGAREATNNINAVFDRLEKKREELIGEVTKAHKEACQCLNDVRTTSRALRQGVEAVQRTMRALGDASTTLHTIQRAGQAGRQLRDLVEASKRARTKRNHAVPVFQHSGGERFSVQRRDEDGALGPARRIADDDEPWQLPPLVPPAHTGELRSERSEHAAVVTASGKAYVVGGRSDNGRLDNMERLQHEGEGEQENEEEDNEEDGAHEICLGVGGARFGCAACAVGDTVIVVGNGVVAVDTTTGACTALPQPPTLAETRVVSVGDKVVAVGGRNHDHRAVADAWLLDLANLQQQAEGEEEGQMLQWSPLPSMARGRMRHGATAGGGCVFVCGGAGAQSCEMLRVGDEGHGEWEPLPSVPGWGWAEYPQCCYGGGHVFLVGGFVPALFALAVRERQWRCVAAFDTMRFRCAVVCVARRVLVLGGRVEPGHYQAEYRDAYALPDCLAFQL